MLHGSTSMSLLFIILNEEMSNDYEQKLQRSLLCHCRVWVWVCVFLVQNVDFNGSRFAVHCYPQSTYLLYYAHIVHIVCLSQILRFLISLPS